MGSHSASQLELCASALAITATIATVASAAHDPKSRPAKGTMCGQLPGRPAPTALLALGASLPTRARLAGARRCIAHLTSHPRQRHQSRSTRFVISRLSHTDCLTSSVSQHRLTIATGLLGLCTPRVTVCAHNMCLIMVCTSHSARTGTCPKLRHRSAEHLVTQSRTRGTATLHRKLASRARHVPSVGLVVPAGRSARRRRRVLPALRLLYLYSSFLSARSAAAAVAKAASARSCRSSMWRTCVASHAMSGLPPCTQSIT